MLPLGAAEFIRDRASDPTLPAIITFDGRATHFDGAAHIYPVEGRAYDWLFLAGATVHILVRKGIDAEAVIRAVEPICAPYLGVVDTERKKLAYIAEGSKVWQMRTGGPDWQEWFP